MKCPLCGNGDGKALVGVGLGKVLSYDCCIPGGVLIENGMRPRSPREGHLYRFVVLELLDRTEASDSIVIKADRSVVYSDDYGERRTTHPRPLSIPEKLEKLLTAMIRRTDFFGHPIRLSEVELLNMSYTTHPSEAEALTKHLESQNLIEGIRVTDRYESSDKRKFIVTAKGHEAGARGKLLPATTVFISSTCYDLLDARAELAEHLESEGYIVRMSDDPFRFELGEPRQDSIAVCLENLRASDVVLLLIDKRYGPTLNYEPYGDKSATHVEFDVARDCDPPKPVYTYIRDRTLAECDVVRDARKQAPDQQDDALPIRWVAKVDAVKLQGFVAELTRLSGEGNWRIPFSNSTDLKKLATKSLQEYRARL